MTLDDGTLNSRPDNTPRLSTATKARLKRMIDEDRPLPSEYKGVLFADGRAPEFVWPGKPDRVSPPVHSLDRCEVHGIPRFPSSPRHQLYPGDEPNSWRNRLIRGDNLLALAAVREGPLQKEISAAGGIKLIYIDPPFAAGHDYPVTLAIGQGSDGRERARVRGLAYRDSWQAGTAQYLTMIYERLLLMRDVLADDGCIFLHCDWHISAPLRLIMDEIFGADNFVNEIVWYYYNKISAASRCLPRGHDTILFYSKSGHHILNDVRLPRKNPVRQLVRKSVDGVLKNARDSHGKLIYQVSHDRKLSDVWKIPQLQPASAHWTGFSTQKHHDLLARILSLASRPGDLVADFFCGSGTLPVVAERMNRYWIAADKGQLAIHLTRNRLLEGEALSGKRPREEEGVPPRPFEVLSVGPARPPQISFPAADMERPIQAELKFEAVTSGLSVTVRLTGYHVEAVAITAGYGIADKDHTPGRAGELIIEESRLVRIRRSPHGRISRDVLTCDWSDWIDYWAVDFAYGGEETDPGTDPGSGRKSVHGPIAGSDSAEGALPAGRPFHADWNAFRTRKRRSLALESAPISYPRRGRYAIAVMAADIFGNQTIAVREVDVAGGRLVAGR